MKYAKYECLESCKVLSAPNFTQWITWRLCRCVWCDKEPVPAHRCLRRNVDTSFICGMGAHPLWKQVCNFRSWTSCKYLEHTCIRRTNDYTQVLNSWHYILKIVRFFFPLGWILWWSQALSRQFVDEAWRTVHSRSFFQEGVWMRLHQGRLLAAYSQTSFLYLQHLPPLPFVFWWYLGAWNTSWICSLELLL